MNILMFVMTMLMLLSILTYARIDSTRSFIALHTQFENYMQVTERHYINAQNVERYESTSVTTKTGEKTPSTRGSGKVPVRILVDEDEHEANVEQYLFIREITQKLIRELFKEEKFFKDIEKERPQFLDELFDVLLRNASKLSAERPIRKAQDLAGIDVGDETLQKALFEVLRERPSPDDETKMISLLDYIIVDAKGDGKVRLQLASKPVLMVFFNSDESTVNDVMEQRYQLFSKLSYNKISGEEAKKTFEGLFRDRLAPNKNMHQLADFTITKTNPRKYD